MGKTKIEWTEYSWNPLRGVKGKWHCTKVSPGCANCYAERVNHRFGGPAYTVGADEIRLDDRILTHPRSWRKPRMVFVCSMTDLFHEGAPQEAIDDILWMIRMCPRHTFQVLTKRPERAKAMMDYHHRVCGVMPNLWLGVSCENQEMYEKRGAVLAQIPAAVRWISFEPLLGPIQTTPEALKAFDWAVVGGESGPRARPFDPEWGRELLRQSRAAGVAFFGKQWDKKRELPEDLRVREWPKGWGE